MHCRVISRPDFQVEACEAAFPETAECFHEHGGAEPLPSPMICNGQVFQKRAGPAMRKGSRVSGCVESYKHCSRIVFRVAFDGLPPRLKWRNVALAFAIRGFQKMVASNCLSTSVKGREPDPKGPNRDECRLIQRHSQLYRGDGSHLSHYRDPITGVNISVFGSRSSALGFGLSGIQAHLAG